MGAVVVSFEESSLEQDEDDDELKEGVCHVLKTLVYPEVFLSVFHVSQSVSQLVFRSVSQRVFQLVSQLVFQWVCQQEVFDKVVV